MAAAKQTGKPRGWTKASRETFLATLAETSNVTASASAAKMPVSSVYALRRKSPEFRIAWSEALSEGYARLEASLLETVFKKASGPVDPDTLRRDAQKHRLALSLLAQHRPSVKGMTTVPPPTDPKELKAKIMERIALMHHRIEAARSDDEPNR